MVLQLPVTWPGPPFYDIRAPLRLTCENGHVKTQIARYCGGGDTEDAPNTLSIQTSESDHHQAVARGSPLLTAVPRRSDARRDKIEVMPRRC